MEGQISSFAVKIARNTHGLNFLETFDFLQGWLSCSFAFQWKWHWTSPLGLPDSIISSNTYLVTGTWTSCLPPELQFFFICEIRLILLSILRLIGSNRSSISEFCKKCQINIGHSLLNQTEVSHFPRETWWNSWVSLARTFMGGKVSLWGN